MTGQAEFPYQMLLIYGTSCNNPLYVLTTGAECHVSELSWDLDFGASCWFWFGPSVFNGIPESDYLMTICGILGNPARIPDTERTSRQAESWGRIKARYQGSLR